MSTPWAQTTILSSGIQSSIPIALDPLAKMTAVQLTFSSTGVGAVFVQATLDTPAFSASGGIQPQPQPIWSAIGSSNGFVSATSTSSGSGGQVATPFDNSAMFVLLQPVAGLRLSSSAAGAMSVGTVNLRALQSPAA